MLLSLNQVDKAFTRKRSTLDASGFGQSGGGWVLSTRQYHAHFLQSNL